MTKPAIKTSNSDLKTHLAVKEANSPLIAIIGVFEAVKGLFWAGFLQYD